VSDASDPSGARHRRRRDPTLGDSRAPITTFVVLAAAATAVIAGFLILRSVTDPKADADEPASELASTVAAPTSTTVAAAPATTTDPPTSTTTTTTTGAPSASKSDATVVVVNASGVDRSATAMSDELSAHGYTTAPVANSTGPYLDRSVVYYVDGDDTSLAVARLLADQIPTALTMPMPKPPPLDRPLDQATVALMLGRDAAGRPLAELAPD
jgi:LytR cell envelope-related transcriptional attenuator